MAADKEYIERGSIYRRVKTHTNPYGKPTLDYESGVKVLDMIKQEPAADVVEVRHGEWISVEGDVIWKCSLCDAEISTSWDYENEDMFKYCPCCGAKMDGERKDKS